MTTFVKLYVQGELSKMPVVYDRFGTNGLTVNYASFVNIKILEKNMKMYNALSNLNSLIILGLLGGGGGDLLTINNLLNVETIA